jgi:hypothetical protein
MKNATKNLNEFGCGGIRAAASEGDVLIVLVYMVLVLFGICQPKPLKALALLMLDTLLGI